MNSEAQKMTVIRRHLSQILPGWRIEDGSRTGVDRTIMLFDGATLRSTIQIGMDLLQDTRLSPDELEQPLRNSDLADRVRSGPVVYLNNNTLGIKAG
jgi:hypothetical protein